MSEQISDTAWMLVASYEALLEHFAVGSLANKYHNGSMGRLLSETMDAKCAGMTAAEINAIKQRVAQKAPAYKGVMH